MLTRENIDSPEIWEKLAAEPIDEQIIEVHRYITSFLDDEDEQFTAIAHPSIVAWIKENKVDIVKHFT